jgi:hypothetical protein
MAKKKWIIKPKGTSEIVITIPDDVEWNPGVAEIAPATLLRAIASYLESEITGRAQIFDCKCNLKG